jgi:hypothetical protein
VEGSDEVICDDTLLSVVGSDEDWVGSLLQDAKREQIRDNTAKTTTDFFSIR